MSIKRYHKLVRDRIPEIIEASGKVCKTKILSDEEYLKLIDEKLDEELEEYHEEYDSEKKLEELADLMEVIYAAAQARGYSVDALEQDPADGGIRSDRRKQTCDQIGYRSGGGRNGRR